MSVPPQLRGKVTDYGDFLHVEQWLLKGQRLRFTMRAGVPRDTTPADRIPTPGAYRPSDGKVDWFMDLQADKQVPLNPEWTDEVGNPVPTPADATVTYTVDNIDVIALTDNGDGTAIAAATGILGNAIVHGEATSGGRTLTADELITVVPGNAERFAIVAGEPTEVTPDTP